MRMTLLVVSAMLLSMTGAGAAAPSRAWKPVAVRVEKTDGGHRLLRDGEPYLIKGVGGQTDLALLKACGGNSIRTWGAERLGDVLDEAHKHGLTVLAGIWLAHERHGFNYNDADQVAKQFAAAREVIVKYRDHPALLAWGIGNEMEGYGKADNAAIWSAINSIAAMAHKLDPNHPTFTVVAEIGGDRVKNIHRLCPEIDVVGINSYAGAATVPERYKKAGGTKSFVLTEFGPAGTWESKKNHFGAVPEPTSTQKAKAYKQAYEKAVLGAKGRCLGAYAFLWGQKQEATATWFGMLLPGGKRLAAADVMQELWTGKAPKNRCPEIRSLTLTQDEVDPGATITAKSAVVDPEGDALKVRWVLQSEAEGFGTGGDAEAAPPTFPDAIVKADASGATVKVPKSGGVYRLFLYVEDGHGGAAVGNVLVRVKGPVVVAPARKATLPLVVYDEGTRKDAPFAPTGWMGETKSTKLDPEWAKQPRSGKTCIRIDYDKKDGWAGIVWQHPYGDWGDRSGGWDLRGAKKLTFWARGEEGGEVVGFEFGLLGKDKKYADSAKAKLAGVKLTKAWKQYEIDLSGKDLSRIKTGFCCTWAASGKPITFYLDDVCYE
jgi:exo-beta-1,3-glucanase (GH17 family)